MRRYYLRQRSEGGNYYAIFMNAKTKKQDFTRCTGTANYDQADSIAQDWLENGPPETDAKYAKKVKLARKTTFCDYLKSVWEFDTSEYIKEKITEGKTPGRRHSSDMLGQIERYYQPYFKQTLLCEITEEKMTEFLVYLRTEKKLAAATVKLARNAGIIPLRFAKRKKIIRDLDFDNIIKVNGDPEERGILDREQVEALFKVEWRDPRSRLINLIASQTAMRIGEIKALRVCDIFEDRLNVQHSWSDKDGGLKGTKNRSTRTIPIMPELYFELDAYMKQKGLYSGLDNLVFPGKKEEKPYCNRQIYKHTYEAMRKIGISEEERQSKNFVVHSWRHYGAKHLAQVTDRITAMAILGQKTPTLYDHYANHTDGKTFSEMRDAINKGLRQENKKKTSIQFFKVE